MPKNKIFKSYLTQTHNFHFHFKNIDVEKISSIIDKLAPKTICGFNGLSTKLIKTIKAALLRPITVIINQMINNGTFPDKLKIAKIIPIQKKMKPYLQIIDQFHFYLQFQKSLKR